MRKWVRYMPDGQRLDVRREPQTWIVKCGDGEARSAVLDVALIGARTRAPRRRLADRCGIRGERPRGASGTTAGSAEYHPAAASRSAGGWGERDHVEWLPQQRAASERRGDPGAVVGSAEVCSGTLVSPTVFLTASEGLFTDSLHIWAQASSGPSVFLIERLGGLDSRLVT
jgi:hypothetical protein